jgi:hypothetical protein
LALVYIITISVIVLALATWASNDLNNTTHFKSARALDYAASSATETAIQSIRFTPVPGTFPSPNPSTTNYCWTPPSGPVSQLQINGDWIAVWCSTLETLNSTNTRVVTFSACSESAALTSGTAPAAQTACVTNPLLAAKVSFNDYPPGNSPPLQLQCTTYCGESATTQEWTWQ